MPTKKLPKNSFKQRLENGERLYGLWTVLGSGYAAEMLAGCGYDWILIDVEHGPNDLHTVREQLQGIAAASQFLGEESVTLSQPVVRIPHGDEVLMKQYMEAGVRNFLVPMVDTPEQASALVSAVKYPPHGTRGVGATLGRASQWGRYSDYLASASDEICLILQIESTTALENVKEIASTPDVSAVFFGPSDLAADMGLPGQPNHPDVSKAIEDGLEVALTQGIHAGIMLVDPQAVKPWFDKGISFAGIGVDTILLTRAADKLLAEFK